MNFFDADCLAGKDRAEVNLFATETDLAAICDDHDFVVEGLINIRQSLIGAGLRVDRARPDTSCPRLRESVLVEEVTAASECFVWASAFITGRGLDQYAKPAVSSCLYAERWRGPWSGKGS